MSISRPFMAFLFICFSCCVADAQTRTVGLACVKKYYNVKDETSTVEPEMAFSPSEATQLIRDIAERSELGYFPTAITCDYVDNAVPFVPIESDSLPHPLNSKSFIIYKRSWLRTVLGSQREKAIFVLGHELGHITRRHTSSSMARIQMEREADYDGACAVAKLGGKWETLVDAIYQNRDDNPGDYPSARQSIEIAKVAFADCGGNQNPSKSTKILYWYKRADNGRVVEALNALSANLEVRQSGIYEGVDFSDRETTAVTCHEGAPISYVKKVALALIDNGVKITGISEPDNKNKGIRNRITIEATSHGQVPLRRSDVERLNYCPSQLDDTFGTFR